MNHCDLYIMNDTLNNISFNSYLFHLMEKSNLVKTQEWDVTIYTTRWTRIDDPQIIIDQIWIDPTKEYVSDKDVRAFEWQQKWPDGTPTILQMWSVWVKIKSLWTPREEILLDTIRDYVVPVWWWEKIEPLTDLKWNNYISDMHTWKYDLKWTSLAKQEKKYIKAINTATERMYNMWATRFWQYYMWDDTNSDWSSKTTKGTEQHNTAKERDQVEAWLNIVGETTDYSSKLWPTDLAFVPWNHNKTIGEIMWMFVERIYRDHPNVEYDWNTDAIQFKKYWDVGIWLFHGDTIKASHIIPLIFKSLKNIKVAEWRHGHIHTYKVTNDNWWQVIANTALCDQSEWTRDYNVGRDYNKLTSAIYDTKWRIADLFTNVK